MKLALATCAARPRTVRVGVGAADHAAIVDRDEGHARRTDHPQLARLVVAHLRVVGVGLAGGDDLAGRTAGSSPSRRCSPRGSRSPQSSSFALLGCTRFGSPFCLRKCGGQGASPRPSASSRAASSCSESSEWRDVVDRRRRVAALGEPRGHGVEAQLGGVDVGDLVPLERRRDARVGDRADRPGGGDGAVAGVLVVVDEDAVALLLPPLRGRQLRQRRSTSRASASAARRTSVKSHFGSIRTLTWIPREPEVFG